MARNNGQITKQILEAANTLTGSALESRVTALLNSFPLASTKLIYDADRPKVPDEAWDVLMSCAYATDRTKCIDTNAWLMASMGSSGALYTPMTVFGRYKA